MTRALDLKVKDCPVCAVMKNKRPKKPTAVLIEKKRQWRPWEKVFSDSLGKFAVMSLQENYYYNVFVCARSGNSSSRTRRSHAILRCTWNSWLELDVSRSYWCLIKLVRFFRRPWDPDLLLKVCISTQRQKMSTIRLDRPNVPSTRLIEWLEFRSLIRTFPNVTGISLASTALYWMPWCRAAPLIMALLFTRRGRAWYPILTYCLLLGVSAYDILGSWIARISSCIPTWIPRTRLVRF